MLTKFNGSSLLWNFIKIRAAALYLVCMQPDRLGNGNTRIYITLVVKFQENIEMEQFSSGFG
jgi:hypothetical protein